METTSLQQKEYIGSGSIEECVQVLKELKPKSIFLVTGKDSFLKCGAKERMTRILEGYKYFHFDKFECNPKIEDVNKGVSIFLEQKSDLIIAIGGGSIIDMAKSINFAACNNLDLVDYLKTPKQILNKGKSLIAIPTTAGSGSQATHFAVLYNKQIKYSLAHPYILPEIAIVDPDLTLALPPGITAVSGMDALTQAIESYWNINSTEESRRYSREAIELILNNLVQTVNTPDQKNRLSMAMAAHLSGKAINLTKTTAAHSVSYPITTHFNVPHGHAVALTLPSFFIFNYNLTDQDILDSRGVLFVRERMNEIFQLFAVNNAQEAKQRLEELIDSIGLERSLERIGIKSQEDIEKIITEGFSPNRVKNNPRRLTPEALRNILEGVL